MQGLGAEVWVHTVSCVALTCSALAVLGVQRRVQANPQSETRNHKTPAGKEYRNPQSWALRPVFRAEFAGACELSSLPLRGALEKLKPRRSKLRGAWGNAVHWQEDRQRNRRGEGGRGSAYSAHVEEGETAQRKKFRRHPHHVLYAVGNAEGPEGGARDRGFGRFTYLLAAKGRCSPENEAAVKEREEGSESERNRSEKEHECSDGS
eukprot:3306538-Rhodomonas_salina.1